VIPEVGRASACPSWFRVFEGGLKPALLFVLGTVVAAGAEQPATPTVRWLTDATPPTVEAAGLAPEAGATLIVFAEPTGGGDAPSATIPPMMGTREWREGRWRFTPQFPLTRGVRYRAELHVPGAAVVVAYFALPPDTAPATTTVLQIYPSAAVLPENQLKFYVQFSAPMSRGIYEHVKLRDAAGRVIEDAFLELDEELWDGAMTRATLLIDPGRIKRGVKPLEDIGPVFETGKTYTLTIGETWRDGAGRPLRMGFAKTFRVAEADRTSPNPERWGMRVPAAGTHEPLVVEFGESLDWALAQRMIGVSWLGGETVAGAATVEANETRWRFVPAEAWRRGTYGLQVDSTIEDLAGNNIGKRFDVDLAEGGQKRVERERVTVRFEVK
jgi:hypothetical protein